MTAKLSITQAAPKLYRIDDTASPLRVCAYCRVSTDKSDQRNSYRAQKQFFESEFRCHPNWIDCRVFADEGISGTSLKKRTEFNQMIALAQQGRYDLIITKEVSRFSRNIQDLLNIASALRERGVFIWFMAEDINTEQLDCRERLIETGRQAEAESLKTSKRVRWGHRRQMMNGVVFGRREMYGYQITRSDDGRQQFEIIQREADTVRQIFRLYAAGYGTFKIAQKLENDGVPTKRAGTEWSHAIVLRILKNEKYVGDLESGKTYTPNALSHDKKANRGGADRFYITDHHPESAIIDRQLWTSVQQLLQKRAQPGEGHSNRYWCSGKVCCGECGARFVSRIKHLKGGGISQSWKCRRAQQYGSRKPALPENGEGRQPGCCSQSVNNAVLLQGAHELMDALTRPALEKLSDTLNKAAVHAQAAPRKNGSRAQKKLERQAEELNEALVRLTVHYSDGTIPEALYQQARDRQLSALDAVRAEIRELSHTGGGSERFDARQAQTLRDLVMLQEPAFNAELFGRMIEKIVVYNGHILEYYFYAVPSPIRLYYTAHGRRESFSASFTVQ